MRVSIEGGSSRIWPTARSDAIIATAGASSPLPYQWSPSPWVLKSRRIGAPAAAVAGSIAASIAAVSRSSQSVSTSNDSPSPTINPAFDSPSPPFGCSHAQVRAPTSTRPPSKATGSPSGVLSPLLVPIRIGPGRLADPWSSYQRL